MIRIVFRFTLLSWLVWPCPTFGQAQTNWASLTVVPRSGEVGLRATGLPGSLYRLETCTDLEHWSTAALAINETGDLILGTPLPEDSVSTYYRLLIDGPSHRVVDEYCCKTAVVSPNAKLDLFRFCDGLNSLGLLTNLVDFAFFCEGMQPSQGEPVSWHNTGKIVGRIDRLRGGFALPNYLTSNYFYITNLPPTPKGRTLVLWGAGNMAFCGVPQDTDVPMLELASAGAWPQPMRQMFFSSGGYRAYSWNGSMQRFGSPWYLYSGYENSLFCASLSSSASGYQFSMARDAEPSGEPVVWGGTDNTAASPVVVRFGMRTDLQPQSGWNGIYRGFAYFDTVLTPSQIRQLDAFIPRIGLIIEGESKSLFGGPVPELYFQWWLNAPQTWGIYSLRTNSATSGTRVAKANAQINDSMEDRFPALTALRTNAQFPIVLYSLRGGHNDFVGPEAATQAGIDNAFTAITNLWALARRTGFQAVGWTIDRTAATWSGGSPGNSNLLNSLNSRLRAHQTEPDFFVDNEMWCVARFGETPFTNPQLYYDQVHDWPGAPLLGTNMLGAYAWPSLGYEPK